MLQQEGKTDAVTKEVFFGDTTHQCMLEASQKELRQVNEKSKGNKLRHYYVLQLYYINR